jgi:WD40 repeat protein
MRKVNIKWIVALFLAIIVFWFGQRIYVLYFLWANRLEILHSAAQLDKPTEASVDFSELTYAKIPQIQEVGLLDPQDNFGGITALAESPDREYLLVVHSNGLLRRWDIASKRNVSEMSLGIASYRGTNFNEDGNWVLTPGRVNADGTISGRQIINTETNELVDCYNAPNCPGEHGYTDVYGQLLSPKANLLIYYNNTDVTINPELEWRNQIDFLPSFIAGDCLFRNGFDDFQRGLDVRRVAIASSQKYIAYILEGGEICVRDMEEVSGIDMETGTGIPFSPDPKPSFDRLRFDLTESDKVDALALEFDPTNRWLAALTNQELAIWDLSNFFSPEKIFFSISNGTTLSFDRTGNLLALGTTNEIIIFNVFEGVEITKFQANKVTALYFTHDNRLLIWGDADGSVHLWGVK